MLLLDVNTALGMWNEMSNEMPVEMQHQTTEQMPHDMSNVQLKNDQPIQQYTAQKEA